MATYNLVREMLASKEILSLHLKTAFYKPTETRHKILLESRAFPSDHYAIESQLRLNGRTVEDSMVDFFQILLNVIYFMYLLFLFFQSYTLEFSGLYDFILFTSVRYFSLQGCLVGWDLAHAFVNVPLHLHWWDVDFACWCSYKYGCTGAGGLAGIFIHER
uniref:TLC domain-containing protein n=1 Tax=Heterorhabditis bacteriophora TaxID=37862 RepID=A0A1I7XUZ0_HETBA